MKKMKTRALSLLLLSFLVMGGMLYYISRYLEDGDRWALYFSAMNSESTGQLLDRQGRELAFFSGSESKFAADEKTRRASYHLTGDYWNRTGQGVLADYMSQLQGFRFLTGTTKVQHSALQLTVDAQLNNLAYEALAGRPGAVLLCDYTTGEMLAFVSTPGIDPALPVFVPPTPTPSPEVTENPEDPEASPAPTPAPTPSPELPEASPEPSPEIPEGYQLAPEGAYINRCLSATFTPGSIFKLVTAAAAMEQLPDLYEREYYCYGGVYTIAGVDIVCSGYHGAQSFEDALANSCNCAFAQIAELLGQETLVKYVKQYGFLDRQELEDFKTAAGTFPLEFVGDPETAWSAIGQSTDSITPYAMLRYVCAIANGGELVQPRLIQDEAKPQKTSLIDPDTAGQLKGLMHYTAVKAYEAETAFPGLKLCAKTGTAELGDGMSHAWFVGFLDDAEHPYAFVVLVERGGGGRAVAGPIAGSLLQAAVQADNTGETP